MLSKLHIQNYAIIDDIQICFSEGLTIITGETGAGKSILIGALNLILGERADTSVLLHENKKCVVEGVFKIKNTHHVQDFFLMNDLDIENEIVLRREISVNGKSRSFINDTPVNLSQVKALSLLLIDLHQQFDTLDLNSANFQRQVVDALADNVLLLQNFQKIFLLYQSFKKQLDILKHEQAIANKEQDYNGFLFKELEDLNFKENELEDLDAELSMLNNAESIKAQLTEVVHQFNENEQNVIQQLKAIQQKLRGLIQYQGELKELHDRINSTIIELNDVDQEVQRIEQALNYDKERISIINDRISEGYKLQKKHGVNFTNDLIQIKNKLEAKIMAVQTVSDSIVVLEGQVKRSEEEAKGIAKIISEKRIIHAVPFMKKVNALLSQVGMPNSRLQVKVDKDVLTINGGDSIEFLFDANKSNRFESLRKVASGGELSRLMLSIKSLVANKLQLPTLIFDEIDTGISGEAAKQVGLIMKSMSAGHQLIAITHQAQIAAKADAHFFVYKEIQKDKIVTAIRLLNGDERISAIAQMLSGEKPTAAALENAREMVNN